MELSPASLLLSTDCSPLCLLRSCPCCHKDNWNPAKSLPKLLFFNFCTSGSVQFLSKYSSIQSDQTQRLLVKSPGWHLATSAKLLPLLATDLNKLIDTERTSISFTLCLWFILIFVGFLFTPECCKNRVPLIHCSCSCVCLMFASCKILAPLSNWPACVLAKLWLLSVTNLFVFLFVLLLLCLCLLLAKSWLFSITDLHFPSVPALSPPTSQIGAKCYISIQTQKQKEALAQIQKETHTQIQKRHIHKYKKRHIHK